jgi:hypothetical protein
MTSNIEPIAREITEGICRDNQMPETRSNNGSIFLGSVLRRCLRLALWMNRANGSKEKTCAVD